MKTNQHLDIALKLADFDFNRIGDEIDEKFNGSLDAYINYVRQISTDFETALSDLIFNSTQEQIITYANLNISKIDIGIKVITVFKAGISKNQSLVDNDADNYEIFHDFYLPVMEAHFSQLSYLRSLLVNLTIDIKGQYTLSENNIIDKVQDGILENEIQPDEVDSLNSYNEYLSMDDMQNIFKVRRNAIYTKEKDGHFKRCSAKNAKVLFKKTDIISYLNNR